MKTITVVVALLVSVSAFAHHNYRLRFDYDVNVEMDVVVTKFDWKNPHIEILVDVENDDGTTTPWVMPTMTPGVANRLGITPDTLQAGDRIHVTGAPARNGSNELRARTMTLADGTYYILSPQGYRQAGEQNGGGMGGGMAGGMGN
jgi:hypothetical protein